MTTPEVIERLQNPVNKTAIARGIVHGQRLRFHNDVTLDLNDTIGGYLSMFRHWVSEILPADKYDRFCELMTFPLATNELVKTIYQNLERVFEAENKVIKLNFADKKMESEFISTFDHYAFQRKVFKAIQTNIDTIVICDAPVEKVNDYPDPYYYFIDIANVIDLDVTDNEVTFIAFRNGEKVVVYDAEFIRTFTEHEGEFTKTLETPNLLKRVPARMMWSDLLRSGNEINRKSPLTNVLGKLDKWLFDTISRDYAELYGKYPILVTYEIQKEFDTGRDDAKNKGKGKHLKGPGSTIETPIPQSKEEVDLNINAVRFINADTTTLKFIDERLLSDRQQIFISVVGSDNDMKNEQAKNVKQIQAGFESKQDVLNGFKKNFEDIHQWVATTLAQIKYGEKFSGCEIDYGSEFYLIDPSDILVKIGTSKANNVPDQVIMDMTVQYFNSKYRTDSETRARMEILRDLDPFPSSNVTEIFALFAQNAEIVGREDLYLKTHFEELINRFERENVSLVDFGDVYSYREKINVIKQTLLTYVKEKFDPSKQDPIIPNTGK